MKPQYTVNISGSAAAYTAAATQAAKDSIDIHPIITFNGDLIAQLNWVRRQGFTFRGHTLVWHSQTPALSAMSRNYSTTISASDTLHAASDALAASLAGLERREISLRVFDILGKAVAVLADGIRDAGSHTVTFNATGLPTGVYFCQLVAGPNHAGRRLLLLR